MATTAPTQAGPGADTAAKANCIVRVDTALRAPTPTAIQAPRFAISSVHDAVVRLTAEDGCTGFGYAYTFDADSAEAVRNLLVRFGAAYVGADASELRSVRSRLLGTELNFLGVRGLARVAAAALDMAAWDLLCRSRGTDLGGLVGRERASQPAYAAYGLWAGLAPDECARVAKEVTADLGTPHVKMWIGDADHGFETERVAAVRDALGAGARIIVDAAQAYSWRSAVLLAEKLAPLDILWFEDPVEYEDMAGLRAFAASSPIAPGTGEHIYGLDHLKQLLDTEAVAYVVLDLERIGGITDFLAAGALCEAARVEVGSHVFTHVSGPLLATLRTGGWCEYSPLWDGALGRPPVADGRLHVTPGVPGIGAALLTEVNWT